MMKKIFVIVLAVALLGAAVGVGIHILHKKAFAVQTYTVTVIHRPNEGGDDPIENAGVRFWNGADVEPEFVTTTNENGVATYDREAGPFPTTWWCEYYTTSQTHPTPIPQAAQSPTLQGSIVSHTFFVGL